MKERVRQMGFGQYQFPLQRWIGAYEIYRIDAVEIPEKDAFMIEVQKLINEGKLAAEGSLEVGVVTMYLRNHFKPTNVPKRLKDATQECGIWGILHRTARSFVEANRPAELDLFDDMYESGLPRACFINFYGVDVISGVLPHRDHVSFCTIVLCLYGTGEGNLVLTKETGEPLPVSLTSNELVVFARIHHSVNIVARSDKRITLNAFF